MEERYEVLSDPTVEQVEAAIRGSGPAFARLCAYGPRSVLLVGRLSPDRLQDLELARATGYLVHRDQEPARSTFDAWQALCAARGRPMVRVWARGVRSSIVELDLSTCAQGRLSEADFERLWALLSAHSHTVEGGLGGLCATGVVTGQAEAIAAAMVDVVSRVWADGQG